MHRCSVPTLLPVLWSARPLRTHRRSPPLHPRLQQSRCRPLRSPSPALRDLHELPKTHLLHPLSDVPVDERTLGVHQVKLWSILEKTSAIAVELLIMQTARITFARSPPGTTVGGW